MTVPEYAADKLNYDGLYLLEEWGNRHEMMLTPEEIQQTNDRNAQNRYGGVWVYIGGTNVEVTKGCVDVYDIKSEMLSTNIIYKSKKGFYIKKRNKKYYLDLFE
jgi:lipocalin